MSGQRWREAQNFEFKYWTTQYAPPPESVYRYAKIREQVGHLAPGAKVVDVGGGPYHVDLLEPADHTITVGLDPLAQRFAQLRVSSRSNFVAGTGEHLPFRDDTFDVAVSVNALDHSVSPRACLLEIERVVKPSGILLSC